MKKSAGRQGGLFRTCRKSRGDWGFRGWEKAADVKKDGQQAWVNVIWWTVPGVKMGQRRVLVWETGLFDRLDFLGNT